MATVIKAVNNQSDVAVAYVGRDAGTPTGWAAWGFAPADEHDFGWTITPTHRDQMIFTKAGSWFIWDDNWKIRAQRPSGAAETLVSLDSSKPLTIEIDVDAEGRISGKQT